jgi:hypothetical protein
MLKLAPIALAVALLSGCASDNYRMYADTQKAIANANAMAEAARYQALAEIAKQGDTAAKVAAVMSLNQGGAGAQRPQQVINPPEHWGDTALRWASLVLPVTTQFYTVNRNSAVAMRQSDNATLLGVAQSNNQANVAINTNTAFTNMNAAGLTAANNIATTGFNTANSIASLGFSAATTIANTGFSTTANVANTGMGSLVSVSNNGSNNMTSLGTAFSNASVNMTNAHSNAVSNLANTIPNLQPIVTTTTTSTANTTTNNNCGANVSGGTLTCP